MKEILLKLTQTFGNGLKEAVLSLLPQGCDTHVTPLGTIQVRFPGESDHTLLLDAHMDTIHFVVTGITAEGFLKVAPCGGVDCRVLAGSAVTVWAKEPIFGLFAIMPPHLKNSGDSAAVSVEEQGIDIGYSCEQAKEKVAIGDYVTLKSTFSVLANNRYCARGLDNLAGVAILIQLAHKLHNVTSLKSTIVLQFSALEETGHRFAGAVTGAFAANPREAIVIDASFAAVPGLQYATPGESGDGVMIGCSPMLSSDISNFLRSIAQDHTIPFTCEVMGGASGTNANGIQGTGVGIPTGLVSYPLKNMHTAVEMVDPKDLENLLALLMLYCEQGGAIYGM